MFMYDIHTCVWRKTSICLGLQSICKYKNCHPRCHWMCRLKMHIHTVYTDKFSGSVFYYKPPFLKALPWACLSSSFCLTQGLRPWDYHWSCLLWGAIAGLRSQRLPVTPLWQHAAAWVFGLAFLPSVLGVQHTWNTRMGVVRLRFVWRSSSLSCSDYCLIS